LRQLYIFPVINIAAQFIENIITQLEISEIELIQSPRNIEEIN